MLVLGIDPGIAITGFGLVQNDESGNPRAVCYGTIDSTAEGNTCSRLVFLYTELNRILDEYQPQACAVEKLFFQKNAKTAMSVSEARGVILLCLSQHGYRVHEYSPNAVKQSVSSYGNADKKQVQEMVRVHLQLEQIPRPDDAADALAIALCHLGTCRLQELMDEG